MKILKRKILSIIFIFSAFYLPYSCTTNMKKISGNPDVILEDYDEFAIEGEVPESDTYIDEIANDDQLFRPISSPIVQQQVKFIDLNRAPSSITLNENGINYYQVKPFDTLMLIAYQIYGDYSRWRELVELNRQYLDNDKKIIGRPKLKFTGTPYEWQDPIGKPYFIKPGDTLGKISHKVYGTKKKWRDILENNPRQIKDPNLIFAGFQLFYPTQSIYLIP